MNKNNIVFELNENEKIVIGLEDSIEKVHCCFDAPINFFQNNHEYKIANDSIRELLLPLSFLLSKALNNKLQLHESITQDIGYLSNEALQQKSGLIYKKHKEGFDYWIGEEYSLWNACIDLWIYNDSEGAIILEITPHYKWHFREPKEGENYIPYEEWIKSYKPILIRKISRIIAEEWLNKTDVILKKIEENSKIIFGNKK